jgi:hypothetical protein
MQRINQQWVNLFWKPFQAAGQQEEEEKEKDKRKK